MGISYADVDYAYGFGDSPSFRGFVIKAEKSFQEKLFFGGEFFHYSRKSNFRMNGNIYRQESDYSLFHANINYKVFEKQRFVTYIGAGLSYLNSEATTPTPFGNVYNDTSDTGWNLIAGVRKSISNNFELDANIRHMDVGDDSEQVFNVGARFYPTTRISVNAGYTHINSNFNYMDLGISYHF